MTHLVAAIPVKDASTTLMLLDGLKSRSSPVEIGPAECEQVGKAAELPGSAVLGSCGASAAPPCSVVIETAAEARLAPVATGGVVIPTAVTSACRSRPTTRS